MDWLRALVPGMVAAGVTMLLTPAIRRLALRLRAVDAPGGRKRHGGLVPRLGGVAIFVGVALSLAPAMLWLLPARSLRRLSAVEVAGFTVAVLVVFGVGVMDDIRGVGIFQKLVWQLVAAAILVALGWQFTALRLPLMEGRLAVGVLAPILSVAWVVGVTNAINFIDGLDGLAAGMVAIIASSLLILAVLQGVPETVVAMSAIVGACAGFLRHNWRPAKIFMGDSGALTLGFLLGAVTLRSSVKASAVLAILVPLLALGLPIIDTLLVMWYRFLRGHRKMNRFVRVFHADRKHLHHLLLETHTERSRTMLTLYGLAIVFCAMALVVAASGSLGLAVAFLTIEVGAVILIRQAGLRAAAGRLAADRLQRLEHPTGVVPISPDAAAGEPAPVATAPGVGEPVAK
jgi:UDP-GlcNAc:undecaprenyl-phosphate GlcNAc-1-phosphate transferase